MEKVLRIKGKNLLMVAGGTLLIGMIPALSAFESHLLNVTTRVVQADLPIAKIAKSLNLANNGGVDNYIAIFVVGGIGDLVSVDPNFFTLKSGDEVEVQFRLIVPPSAPVDKEYSGRVLVFRLPKGIF